MSHFYGRIPTSARKTMPTARGHQTTGLAVEAAGWNGCVRTYVWHNKETDTDHYQVYLTPWQNSGGSSTLLAEGVLDANSHDS